MTFTTLTLGTPKFKARFEEEPIPIFVTPCVESHLTNELLLDPGFEEHVALFGSTEIPAHVNLPSPRFNTRWINQSVDLAKNWAVSTSAPDAGTYHAQASVLSGTNQATTEMFAVRDWSCEIGFAYSAIVEAGDMLDWIIRMKASQIASGTPTSRLFIGWYDVDFTNISFTSITSNALTTSYATYSMSGIAPAPSHFARVYVHPIVTGAAGVGTTFSLDTCSLVLS